MLEIAGVPIGDGHPCRFVAEISNNHNGSLDRAIRLIDAAKAAGADFVKFQCYTPDELVELRGDGPATDPWGSQGWTMRALYEKAQTPHAWFPDVVAHCEGIGIPWFSSVFGQDSLALLESIGCPAYKVARLDNQANHLNYFIRKTGMPTIVSTSGERPVYAEATDALLWCPASYPQTAFALRQAFAVRCDVSYGDACEVPSDYIGFSYHGTDPLPCVVAATLGAKIIEAHFQLDDEPSELEANVSLTASAFAQMVKDVRRVEAILT